VLLEVDRLRTTAFPQHEVSFSVRAGELVGVAGLIGAGRTELLRTLFGIDPPLGGSVRIGGRPGTVRSPAEAIRAGLALAPEDRKVQGLIIPLPVRENVSLAGLFRNRRWGVFRNGRAERLDAQTMIDMLAIRTPSDRQVVRYLSGGNQQKVVLGKWLSLSPRVLLLDEPTRGIDVGAKQEIYARMESLAEAGVAVLFVSSELEELLGMADRVLVMHEGRLTGVLQRNQLSEEAVMRLATGGDGGPAEGAAAGSRGTRGPMSDGPSPRSDA
jgi:ribose transport system ATP-binding protein